MQQQLNEAKQGLLAATRLNDQLELNQVTIDKLRKESKCFLNYFIFACPIYKGLIFDSVSLFTTLKFLLHCLSFDLIFLVALGSLSRGHDALIL